MGELLIRNMPDEIIESYKERAKAKGHSLKTELREHGRLARARRIRAKTIGSAPPLSLDEIREGLE